MHNFLDGIIMMITFISGFGIGIIVTLVVLFHELPQEIGDLNRAL